MTTDSQPTPEQVEWLTPGTAHYEHLHTKCVVRDIFAAAERGES